jgi:hypothetical protein
VKQKMDWLNAKQIRHELKILELVTSKLIWSRCILSVPLDIITAMNYNASTPSTIQFRKVKQWKKREE